jgi:hypothetical protein
VGLKVLNTEALSDWQFTELWPNERRTHVKHKLLNLSTLSLSQLQWLFREQLLTQAEFEWELEHRGYDEMRILAARRLALGQELGPYLSARVG